MSTVVHRTGKHRVTVGLALLLPLLAFLALSSGPASLDLAHVWAVLTGRGDDQAATILLQIRLPRVLLGAIVGTVLAVSGAVMQGLFRNPLADPSLIGVTAGASLGASLAIVLGAGHIMGFAGFTAVSLGAFTGGLVTVILVYRLSRSGNGTSVATMLLAGIAITALSGSISSLLEFYANNEALRRISLWRMGGLDGADYPQVVIAAVVCGIVLLPLPRFSVALNALLLGESEARHLGIDVDRVKWAIIVVVAIGIGTTVALAGTIGFVGLVVPHIMRMITGPDHRTLLPACALAGAALMLLADTLARTIVSPSELPVGIITSLIGVPFFLSLLRQRHQYGMQS